jgi:hypothetical protein
MTATWSLTGGTSPAVSVTTSTPGTGYKEFVKVAIPGKWSAVGLGQCGAQARQFQCVYSGVRDPVPATMARIQLMNLKPASGARRAWNAA